MSDKIEVINKEINYGRSAVMYIQNDLIQFDTSDLEYGKGVISIELMKQKIKEYEKSK